MWLPPSLYIKENEMKRLLIILGIVFLCVSVASGSPFLVCDSVSADTVTHYLIKIDGATNPITVPAYGNPDGTVMLHYDCGGLSNGNHNFEIAAANIWGQSIYVPFDFAKQVPSGVLNIELSID